MGLEWKRGLGSLFSNAANGKPFKTLPNGGNHTSHNAPHDEFIAPKIHRITQPTNPEVRPSEPEFEPSFLELDPSAWRLNGPLQHTGVDGESPKKNTECDITVSDTTLDPGETWDLSLETNFLGSVFTTHKVAPAPGDFWDSLLPGTFHGEEPKNSRSARPESTKLAACSVTEGDNLFEGTNEYQLARQKPFVPRTFKLQPRPKASQAE